MTTASKPALLNVAVQDLQAGKREQAERLPAIAARCSDPVLADLISREAEHASAQAERIAAAGVAPGSQANLWMNGILDDAERDCRQVQPGVLLDIALIGAIRKAKAAEIVSSETALALATETGIGDLHAVIAQNHAEEIESDRALKRRLTALTDQP